MTKDLVKMYIDTIKDILDDDLVHHLKCALTKKRASEKVLLKPVILAIDKERKRRGTVKSVASKLATAKIPTEGGANPEDYE